MFTRQEVEIFNQANINDLKLITDHLDKSKVLYHLNPILSFKSDDMEENEVFVGDLLIKSGNFTFIVVVKNYYLDFINVYQDIEEKFDYNQGLLKLILIDPFVDPQSLEDSFSLLTNSTLPE